MAQKLVLALSDLGMGGRGSASEFGQDAIPLATVDPCSPQVGRLAFPLSGLKSKGTRHGSAVDLQEHFEGWG